MDFALKLSGELLVLVLSLSVAGLNLFYFSGNSFHDQSPAASFLSRHSELNPKLANKNNSIITTMSPQGLIPRAQAEDLTGVESLGAQDDEENTNQDNIVIGYENYLQALNPDSIQPLIEKQVKVYQTVAGDSLKSIAQQFGINQQTIIWANNLPSTTIKAGWYLLIPPVDGIIVKADSNTTLPDIAATYNPERFNSNKKIREDAADKLLEKIISYNGLADEADIDTNQIVIVPGGTVTEAPKPPAPKPAPKKVQPGAPAGIDVVTSIGAGYIGVNHRFPKGQCTYYVATRMNITFGGNAKNWLANARASGYVTGKDPAPHSAMVMTGTASRAMRLYGHVVYVEAVEGDQIYISEMNYIGLNKISHRWLSVNDPSIRGYIYP